MQEKLEFFFLHSSFNILFSFFFRTTVSVIVLSSLLLYRALSADNVNINPEKNNPEKNNDDKTRIQRLEQRVEELEEQLQAV